MRIPPLLYAELPTPFINIIPYYQNVSTTNYIRAFSGTDRPGIPPLRSLGFQEEIFFGAASRQPL